MILAFRLGSIFGSSVANSATDVPRCCRVSAGSIRRDLWRRFGPRAGVEINNAWGHHGRPRVAWILKHREAERFGTIDKETIAQPSPIHHDPVSVGVLANEGGRF
jgi:hypothetical protein